MPQIDPEQRDAGLKQPAGAGKDGAVAAQDHGHIPAGGLFFRDHRKTGPIGELLLFGQEGYLAAPLLQEPPELSDTHVESILRCLCRGVLLDREC